MIEQRKYQSAAAMCHRVYESCLRLFGPDHWATLEAQMNLVSLETEPNEFRYGGRHMFGKIPSVISYEPRKESEMQWGFRSDQSDRVTLTNFKLELDVPWRHTSARDGGGIPTRFKELVSDNGSSRLLSRDEFAEVDTLRST